MQISPDQQIFWQAGFVKINATLVHSWIVMAVLIGVSWWVTRRLRVLPPVPRRQHLLETVVTTLRSQLHQIMPTQADRILAFVGSLFLYISVANLLNVIPGYRSPTGSLSTTVALAACVFIAVPVYGIAQRGVLGYLRHYIQPTPIMLPFRIVSELSRTLALAVRLFGNVMSGTLIGGILLSFVPLFVPVIMQLFELLIGQIHAYIFAVLAAVYMASAAQTQGQEAETTPAQEDTPHG
jgi:F-type H+-transporting ATPase subunit a